MRIWNDRPPEIAHLFNPAFCALLIREGVLGFGEVSPGGMPYPLVFLLLPDRATQSDQRIASGEDHHQDAPVDSRASGSPRRLFRTLRYRGRLHS
jgi:hypothetical protein